VLRGDRPIERSRTLAVDTELRPSRDIAHDIGLP
jgi:hypothetical protein